MKQSWRCLVLPISKTADIQYSGHEVFWIEDLFKLETTVHFNCDTSSAELLSHDLFFPVRFMMTEHSRIGVMNWLNRFMVTHFHASMNQLRK